MARAVSSEEGARGERAVCYHPSPEMAGGCGVPVSCGLKEQPRDGIVACRTCSPFLLLYSVRHFGQRSGRKIIK